MDQWSKIIQRVGSAPLTHPSKRGRTAREELAVVLWRLAMEGNIRAAEIVLKLDGGDLAEQHDRLAEELQALVNQVYGGADEAEDENIPRSA